MNWTCYIFGHKYMKLNNYFEKPYLGDHRYKGKIPESYHKLYAFCRRCHASRMLHYFFYEEFVEMKV